MIGPDVDKFAWTVIDFIVHRPRRFYARRAEEPGRYMDPIRFAVSNFIIYQAALVATVKVLAPVWDWEYVTGSALPVSGDLDLATVTAVSGGGTLFMLLVIVGWYKLAAIVVRRTLPLKDLLISVAYSMSVNVIAISYFGLVTFFAFVTSAVASDVVNDLGRLLYVVWNLLAVVLFLYCVASAAAISSIPFGRLLVGVIAVPIALVLVLVFFVVPLALITR